MSGAQMEPSQQADLLLIEVGRAISAKNADTVRGAIAQLQSLLDTLKAAEDAEETGEGTVAEAVDPNVGGGVDRSKLSAEDFAGKNRSYPIVTPKDVADAAASIGRAGADNYSADELKSRIIAIAKSKGAAFVAELPEAWKATAAREAAPSPDHGAMSGEHSHPHPAYGAQGGDAMHAHQHTHEGDAAHQHDHGAMAASQDQTPTAEAAKPAEPLAEVELVEFTPLVGAR